MKLGLAVHRKGEKLAERIDLIAMLATGERPHSAMNASSHGA
jgi:hypothetical protein